MTIMRVSLVGTSLSEQQKESMANRLIEAFATVEVGHAAPAVRNGFLVLFESLGRTDLWMGQRPMAEATESGKAAVVSVHVMAGPWNAEMKSELFAKIEEVVRDVAEMPREGAGTDVWMTIVEVPEPRASPRCSRPGRSVLRPRSAPPRPRSRRPPTRCRRRCRPRARRAPRCRRGRFAGGCRAPRWWLPRRRP